jgi:exoribonuclease R
MDRQPSLFIQGKLATMPPKYRRLIISSYETFQEFQSILSLLPLSTSSEETLLIFQSVIRSALASGDQKFQRKCKSLLYDTPSASRIVFLNEITVDTCSDQLENEPRGLYEIRLFVDACMHLQRTLECEAVVLVCDEHDLLYEAAKISGLCVETMKSYLNNEEKLLRSTASTITSLNLSADETLERYRRDFLSNTDPKASSSAESSGVRIRSSVYLRHLSAAEADIGVRNGSLLSGKIYVFPHNSHDAEVAVVGGLTVLISGRSDMNRALDGDTVVIRVHPKTKWNRICGSLTISPQADAFDTTDGSDEEESDNQVIDSQNSADNTLMVTGMVVAIIRRDISEMVVTVPMSHFESTSQSTSLAGSTSIPSDSLERENFILVPPLDMRLPKIRIRTRQLSKLEGHRIIVAFDNWPVDSMYPNGHLVRIIGEANDWKTEVESILIRHSIFPRPFSAQAMACVPFVPVLADSDTVAVPSPSSKQSWRDSGWIMPCEKLDSLDSSVTLSHRRDYRQSRRIFSVDPPGCQDIDDAMNVHWLEGNQGVIEVAVSIADVCAFLPQDCPLDLEAQTRGTTVYLTHMRMDMLPSLISGDTASLHGGKDRFAVTVTWHVKVTHADGRPVNRSEDPLLLHDNNDIIFATPVLHSCGRTAITSVAAMTYSQAHNLIEGRAPDPQPPTVPPGQAGQGVGKHLWEDLRSDLKILTVFARFLKCQRELNGALDLTQTGGELKFKLNGEGEPMDVKCKEEMEVHNTIAELMIIANSTVARIVESFKPLESLVRIHSSPTLSQQKEILKLVKQTGKGIFDGNSSMELRSQLRTFREKMLFPKSKSSGVQDKKTAESIVDFVTSAVIKSMCEAQYVCAGSLSGNIFSGKEIQEAASDSRLGGHYGLGLGHYTHFTSPIRRYADIIVHRQLLAVLESLGGGSGLKRIQLPSLDNSDGNTCIDYSDRSAAILTKPQVPSTSDFLSQGGNNASTEDRKQIELPTSLVPSLGDVVNSNKVLVPSNYYPTHTESLSDEFYPPMMSSSSQSIAALPSSEDDLLNDLLSDSHAPPITAIDTSRGYQWDDSFLDSLLDGDGSNADTEIRRAELSSCLDSGLDFLLDSEAECTADIMHDTKYPSSTHPTSDSLAEKSKLELGSVSHLTVQAAGDSPYSGNQFLPTFAVIYGFGSHTSLARLLCGGCCVLLL